MRQLVCSSAGPGVFGSPYRASALSLPEGEQATRWTRYKRTLTPPTTKGSSQVRAGHRSLMFSTDFDIRGRLTVDILSPFTLCPVPFSLSPPFTRHNCQEKEGEEG
ncbi:hypothetical protein SRHO_G00270010 [Serrasalmus rhombeus]